MHQNRLVTNAYRQVHLLYIASGDYSHAEGSQMPIGKYIYCTIIDGTIKDDASVKSQMPIGKYIYCTEIWNMKTNLL